MKTVGLKELKNRLSEYVRMAEAGETVFVTDRNRVVAEIVPPQTTSRPKTPDEAWGLAIRRGWLTPAEGPEEDVPPPRPVAPLAEVLDWLDEVRSDR